jgi:hypothetical protein
MYTLQDLADNFQESGLEFSTIEKKLKIAISKI